MTTQPKPRKSLSVTLLPENEQWIRSLAERERRNISNQLDIVIEHLRELGSFEGPEQTKLPTGETHA